MVFRKDEIPHGADERTGHSSDLGQWVPELGVSQPSEELIESPVGQVHSLGECFMVCQDCSGLPFLGNKTTNGCHPPLLQNSFH